MSTYSYCIRHRNGWGTGVGPRPTHCHQCNAALPTPEPGGCNAALPTPEPGGCTTGYGSIVTGRSRFEGQLWVFRNAGDNQIARCRRLKDPRA